IAKSGKLAAGKADPSFSVAVASIVGAAVTEFSTEAKRMLAAGVGDVVHPLEGLVRRGKQRPSHVSANLVESINLNGGGAKIDGRGHTCVDAINGCGIRGVIGGENGLPEAVEPEPRFVHPMSIGHPGVVESENLGSELRL